jgi:hypothetical protein
VLRGIRAGCDSSLRSGKSEILFSKSSELAPGMVG